MPSKAVQTDNCQTSINWDEVPIVLHHIPLPSCITVILSRNDKLSSFRDTGLQSNLMCVATTGLISLPWQPLNNFARTSTQLTLQFTLASTPIPEPQPSHSHVVSIVFCHAAALKFRRGKSGQLFGYKILTPLQPRYLRLTCMWKLFYVEHTTSLYRWWRISIEMRTIHLFIDELVLLPIHLLWCRKNDNGPKPNTQSNTYTINIRSLFHHW